MRDVRIVRTSFVLIALIVAIGVFSGVYITRKINAEQRSHLLQTAQHAALLVSPSALHALTATSADLTLPEYITLKQKLTAFRSYSREVRFVYVMGYRPDLGKEFFYVDSEPENSPDYSPPGQIYDETLPDDIGGFLKGETFTTGPYTDAWGQWISGYAPVVDDEGETLAMVGVDIATSVWRRDTAFVVGALAVLTVLLSIIAYQVVRRLYKKQKSIEVLTTQNRVLAKNKETLTEIQSLAQLGKIVFKFKERLVTADDQFSVLFGNSQGSMTFLQFLSYVYPGDQGIVKSSFTEIESSDIRYTWFDARVGSEAIGYRLFHFYGNIERDGQGAAIEFSGIMQDITDIQK